MTAQAKLDLEKVIEFMVSLAEKAGAIIMDYYGTEMAVEWKEREQQVKTARTKIELDVGKMAREEIAKAYPDFSIMSEELPEKSGSNMVFVIDEIDGSNPYFRKYSDHFAFSIGLCKGRKPTAGVVCAPLRKELYVGSRLGAYCNGKPIQVSQTQDMNKVWICIGSGKDNRDSHVPYYHRAMARDLSGVGDVVNFSCGSVQLCLIACGRLDAALFTSLEPEDMAGAVPVLLASGAKLTNKKGEEWQLGDKTIFVANPVLYEKLFKFLGLG